jgi:glucose/arabinose dehydrogenase
MTTRITTLLAITALSLTAQDKIKLTPAWTQLTVDKPISVVSPPDESKRLFLVQQRGLIHILPKDESSSTAKVFLDFTQKGMEAKNGMFEEGLLGLAFHPEFNTNRKFYISYSAQDPKRSVYSEMQVSKADPDKADLSTERVLLEVELPYWNHHCGNLAFGPDGMLYIPMGDGGGKPGGDPLRRAQNLFSLGGKMLRIDVNRTQGSRQYGIPADNPFVGKEAVREEIWAYGLRNPWGIHFDAEGTLWEADVGQEIWEEINHIEKGGNYGWSWRDGTMAYSARELAGEKPPADLTFVDPVHVYDHSQGISITGGLVYRGEKMPSLKDAYIYGDWGHGRVWALRYDKKAKKVVSNELLLQAVLDAKGKGSFKPTAFCEDADKEILGLDWAGKIFRIGLN